ncbi:Serine/threonine-protein phosphatase PP1-2 [Trichinella pseudospiralis]|uniref:Serine/threonine-protein phosphatase n=3 Tax=Trichinella pseudospiralis TaxID=6337 RepID=A0A0V1IQE9_TRIPS|nr:Serine/threonine-protein phosphatase PP1-2 [Trichinella pseudospiralis]KRY88934.1 Serine/threonine-protein phosphatase PP1-2 [Trichinella pseudospiralis]KRZ24764.1 Serine/threonine-protein phosphatase PP1-2 [Trichinella pseudospiralis]KRZ38023.1 Serine/threonine-protein phosphatase PP1-2 [Trichinella pseudospiralis]
MKLNLLNDMIEEVLCCRDVAVKQPFAKDLLLELCNWAETSFSFQPTLLEIEAPVIICGDIHGKFDDLLNIFDYCGYPPSSRYLFLGDLVDRGKQSLECLCLLFLYKIRYPDHVFLLRGNHEFADINGRKEFIDEIEERYQDKEIWSSFNTAFNYMPLAALVGGRIFCMHGGIPRHLHNWDQIRNIQRPVEDAYVEIVEELMWSDPNIKIIGWARSSRGAGLQFGMDVVDSFCRKMDIDIIVRGHQIVKNGHRVIGQQRLIILSSFTPDHFPASYTASVLMVDDELRCHIVEL